MMDAADLPPHGHPSAAGAAEISHETIQASTRRLDFVDSLRGLAALYVLMFHQVFIPLPVIITPSWMSTLVFHGSSGVTLFFVISAFSLCYAQPEGFATSGSLRAFYIRRAARILPLFYVMLLVAAVDNWFTGWPQYSVGQTARALFPVFNLFPGEEGGIVVGSWTIGVEVIFYAIFPFVFVRLRNVASILAAIFAALLASVAFHEFVQNLSYAQPILKSFWEVGFLRHLPVFLIGTGAWMIWDRFIRGRNLPASTGALIILASLWGYHARIQDALNFGFPDTYYWEAIVYSGLLLGLSVLPVRVLVNRATLYCGRISYSLYLLHPTTMFKLRPLYKIIEDWHLTPNLNWICCLGLTLAVVVPLASLSHTFIERPGMRLGKMLLRRWF